MIYIQTIISTIHFDITIEYPHKNWFLQPSWKIIRDFIRWCGYSIRFARTMNLAEITPQHRDRLIVIATRDVRTNLRSAPLMRRHWREEEGSSIAPQAMGRIWAKTWGRWSAARSLAVSLLHSRCLMLRQQLGTLWMLEKSTAAR